MTTTTDLLDLELDDTEGDANANATPAVVHLGSPGIPANELNAAEENLSLSMQANAESTESYEVVDMYPEISLPEDILSAISCDESLVSVQKEVDYLEAELMTAQNTLHNKIVSLVNKAKAELVTAQMTADKSLVTNALGDQQIMRVLATVIRIMQQDSKAGVLMEALDTIEHGSVNNAMARLATTIAPEYSTPMYEPSVTYTAPAQSQGEAVEPIQTTTAPTSRKRAKWVPN